MCKANTCRVSDMGKHRTTFACLCSGIPGPGRMLRQFAGPGFALTVSRCPDAPVLGPW